MDAIEELSGKLSFQHLDDKLMHTVLENDEQAVEKGKLIQETVEAGFGALNVDLAYENLVNNYRWSKKMMGERLIRLLSGYDPNYVENNRTIPEFRRELKQRIQRTVEDLRRAGLVERDGTVTEKGIELSALMLFIEELEHLRSVSSGERHDKNAPARDPLPFARPFSRERYRDISVRKTVRAALSRGHRKVQREDLRAIERAKRSDHYLVYAIDASGSMKGEKLRNAKKAGIALAHRATSERDKVGLLIFSKDVKDSVRPGANFIDILKALMVIRAKEETDLAGAIREACNLFPDTQASRHLILLTDSVPTRTTEEQVIAAASEARGRDITISLIGLGLNEDGRPLAESIVEIGGGRLYTINNLEQLDTIVLEEYERTL